MGILPGITGAVEVGGGLLGSIFGARAQNKLQKKQWEREDNAVQRRALDLQKAGLSKTLAAGSAAQAGPAVHAGSAIDQLTGIPSKLGQAGRNYVNLQQSQEQKAQTHAQTRIIEAEADMKEDERDYVRTHGSLGGYEKTGDNEWTNVITPDPLSRLQRKIETGLQSGIKTLDMQYLMERLHNLDIDTKAIDLAWKEASSYKEGAINPYEQVLKTAQATLEKAQREGRLAARDEKFMSEFAGGKIPPMFYDVISKVLQSLAPHAIYRIGGNKGFGAGAVGGSPYSSVMKHGFKK